MADITSPQAVKFCNEQARRIADSYAGLYYFAKEVTDIWTAQGIGALIPNDASVIVDGSVQDGRATITGAMVNGLITNLQALISDLEANSKLKLNGLMKIAVSPRII